MTMLCLAGCALFGGNGLEQAALKYYRYRLGQSPGVGLSEFFSPAHRELVAKEDLETLDRRLTSRGGSGSRFSEVRLEDIVVSVDGNFGLTLFRGQQGAGLGADEYVRWVKAGTKWYLYMGSGAEVTAYGLFPSNLPPPRLDRDTVEETDNNN